MSKVIGTERNEFELTEARLWSLVPPFSMAICSFPLGSKAKSMAKARNVSVTLYAPLFLDDDDDDDDDDDNDDGDDVGD